MKFEGPPSSQPRIEKEERREWGDITGSIEREFNAEGRITRETTRDSSGVLESEGIFEYDESGRRIRELWNEPATNRYGSYTYSYNEQGQQCDKIWTPETRPEA